MNITKNETVLKTWWLSIGVAAGFALAASLLSGCGKGQEPGVPAPSTQASTELPIYDATTNKAYLFGNDGAALLNELVSAIDDGTKDNEYIFWSQYKIAGPGLNYPYPPLHLSEKVKAKTFNLSEAVADQRLIHSGELCMLFYAQADANWPADCVGQDRADTPATVLAYAKELHEAKLNEKATGEIEMGTDKGSKAFPCLEIIRLQNTYRATMRTALDFQASLKAEYPRFRSISEAITKGKVDELIEKNRNVRNYRESIDFYERSESLKVNYAKAIVVLKRLSEKMSCRSKE